MAVSLRRGGPAGEQLDFDALFLGHARRVVRLAALLGADDPEDVAQEAFCRLYAARERLRGRRRQGRRLPEPDRGQRRAQPGPALADRAALRAPARGAAPPDRAMDSERRAVVAGAAPARRPASGRRWCCGSGWTCPWPGSPTRWGCGSAPPSPRSPAGSPPSRWRWPTTRTASSRRPTRGGATMSIEERLTRVLARGGRAGRRRRAPSCAHRTREPAGGCRPAPDRRRRYAGPVAAAAAVAVLVGGGVLGSHLLGGDRGVDEPAGPAPAAARTTWHTEFTCPRARAGRPQRGPGRVRADPRRPAGRPGWPRACDAPRYAFEGDRPAGRAAPRQRRRHAGQRGVVPPGRGRVGPGLRRGAAPAPARPRLPRPTTTCSPGTHGVAAPSPEGRARVRAGRARAGARRRPAGLRLLGLVTRHRTIYAAPCGARNVLARRRARPAA